MAFMNDKAIEYEALLGQVDKVINNLKRIDIDTKGYEEELENIKDSCNKAIEDKRTGLLSVGYNEIEYTKACTKLNNLLFELNKNEIYLRVASFSSVLLDFVKKKEKSKDELTMLRASLVELLRKLKYSDTSSHKMEGPLVDNIYSSAYKFIKEEIILLGYSPTLQILNSDDIHRSNLEKHILREIETFNSKDPKYERVVARKNELDSEGASSSYLDEILIREIISVTVNSDYYEKMFESLNNQVLTYYENLKSLNSSIISAKIERNNKEWQFKNSYFKKLFKPVALLVTSLSILIGLISANHIQFKNSSKDKKYKTEKTTFDSIQKEPKSEELYLFTDDKTLFLEVNPYTKTEDGFKRTVSTYDVTNLGDGYVLEDYLNLDFDALGIKGEVTEEEKKALTPEDLYEKMYYAIENYKIDESDYRIETNPKVVELLTPITYLIDILLILLYEVIMMRVLKDENTLAIRKMLKELKAVINEYKEYKKDIEGQKDKIRELQIRLKKLFTENKETIIKAIKMLPEVKTRPELHDKAEELENVITRARQIEVENRL